MPASRRRPGTPVAATPTASIGPMPPARSLCSPRAAAPYCTPSWRGARPWRSCAADRPCRALDIAAEHGVPARAGRAHRWGAGFDRAAYGERLVKVLRAHGVDLVVMAGFGTVVPGLPAAFPGRVLNTHPALLPAFKGWHAVRDALALGVKVTGTTIHVATAEVDDGPILAQEAVAGPARRHRGRPCTSASSRSSGACTPPPSASSSSETFRSSEGPALGLRQVRHRRARPRAGRPRLGPRLVAAAPPPPCARPA